MSKSNNYRNLAASIAPTFLFVFLLSKPCTASYDQIFMSAVTIVIGGSGLGHVSVRDESVYDAYLGFITVIDHDV
jgi:hypothetical protein